MRRAYRFLLYNQVTLTKIPASRGRSRKTGRGHLVPTTGLCESDDEISIDYRYDIVPSIVHELLHAICPEWDEDQVSRWERRLMKGLTEKQICGLLRAFVAAMA